MRKNSLIKKCAVLLGCMALTISMVTGCSSNSSNDENTNTGTAASTKLEETLTLSGSTSMEKLATALGEYFMEANPGVTVTAEFTGSSAGVEAVLAGKCDIGNASRNLKDSEKESGAVENIVAIDGIAVVVDKANTVTDITKEQLIAIYTGQVTNWSELGGSDTPIVVIGREAGSGTRGAFEEILKIEDACAYAVECDQTGAVMAKVAATKGAIGYVSLDIVDDSVTALALDGVAATADNIVSGSYFLCRPFVMATKGELSAQSELVQEFFEFIKSEDGQKVVKSVGLIVVE